MKNNETIEKLRFFYHSYMLNKDRGNIFPCGEYHGFEDGRDAVSFFRSALISHDYLLRAAAFALAERLPQCFSEDIMVGVALGEEEREWQLRALSCLGKKATLKTIMALKPLLFQEEKPLLIRGTLWVYATWRGEEKPALFPILAKFFKSPYVSYLKTPFVADALGFALQGDDAIRAWNTLCKEDSSLKAKTDYFQKYAENNGLLQVYPYPDYLSKCGKNRGISPKELKYATYFKDIKGKKEE